ncbi:MAG TPA: DUF1350 family protein [Nostocaceae cyanobacterium]|nr:DUF1350 family protein [Nostocaceae cyanobacterium]
MTLKMQFRPVSHSWVAVHPNPQGVVQFIGGAFFGTFGPMFFYNSLLQSIFDAGYTIILLPFNFTFNHYVEAGFLIKEEYDILPELVRIALKNDYEFEKYLDDANYYWLGHSIGCKYIALLEGFSALPPEAEQRDEFIRQLIADNKTTSNFTADSVIADIEVLIIELKRKYIQAKKLIEYYIKSANKAQNLSTQIDFQDLKAEDLSIGTIFIKNQPSILLAPVNSGTESAIPQPIAGIVDSLGLGVKPTPDLTFDLMKKADLFNLLGLVSFLSDTKLAKSTVDWFDNVFKKPPVDAQGKSPFRYKLKGGHLRPLGWRIGSSVINFPDSLQVPFIESVDSKSQTFESYVTQLLKYLEQKRIEANK